MAQSFSARSTLSASKPSGRGHGHGGKRQRIRCRHLVFATGYELPKRVPSKGHRIVSTWAIATVRQKRRLWPEQCMIWEASDPYLYMRTTADGRVICGGEDEDFSDEAHARRAAARARPQTLHRKLAEAASRVSTHGCDFAWTGVVRTRAPPACRRSGTLPGMRELLARARLWRQRHHLLAHRRRCRSRAALAGGATRDADLYGSGVNRRRTDG